MTETKISGVQKAYNYIASYKKFDNAKQLKLLYGSPLHDFLEVPAVQTNYIKILSSDDKKLYCDKYTIIEKMFCASTFKKEDRLPINYESLSVIYIPYEHEVINLLLNILRFGKAVLYPVIYLLNHHTCAELRRLVNYFGYTELVHIFTGFLQWFCETEFRELTAANQKMIDSLFA